MQRPRSKKTRHANAAEKRFHAYTKEADCIVCGQIGPSIVHHCKGSTFKHNKTLIGHMFVIPLCPMCDELPTKHSLARFIQEVGPQATLWKKHIKNSGHPYHIDVYVAIEDYEKQEQARIS